MTGLAGQHVLVTGGTAGIGLAIAKRAMADGATVVIAGRDAARGQRALDELGTNARYVQGDAAVPSGAAAIVDQAVARLGTINSLFSCAGGNPMPRLLRDIPLDDVMGVIDSAVAPTILPARAVLPVMANAGRGSILCIASDAGKLATPGEVAIGAAMAAIMMFCRSMATEVKRQGIRVNCLTPSIVEGTELHDRLMADGFAGKLFSKAKAKADLGVVTREELAEMAVFLASPEASKVTGQTISVTGGISSI